MVKIMRARHVALFFLSAAFAWAMPAYAETVTLYSQPDDSGEMVSQQPMYANTWISSASLGTLFLGKDNLSITFTMKDPNASTLSHLPSGGVALGTCPTCQDLQKYYFTDTDRALLMDGSFHTFTVQTGTTTLGTADGETPIYIRFFGLSQYYQGTHLKSNAAGTIPYLSIEAASLPTPPLIPQAPSESVTIYTQSDKTAVMTNPQPTYQNSYIDSASLGNLPLGQGEVYLTFTMKDPRANNVYHQPRGICIEPAGASGCSSGMQKYYFTDADRALLADQAFHTFMVETGTTTSTYADGTHSVAIGFFGLSQYQYGTQIKSNAEKTIPFLTIQIPPPPDPCAAPGACASNVLFLPGIEGSRLYRPADGCDPATSECEGHTLWEPGGDGDLADLALDDAGKSTRADVYTKENDIIASASAFGVTKTFYENLVAQMNVLKTGGTMVDWKPIAYDWRLSLPDLLEGGVERDGKIFYAEATRTPYVEQTLRALAASSKTGKVSIVAHSNGGLVAKALIEKLGPAAAEDLIDNVIFVGVPQSGAPQAVGGLLFGYGQALPRDDCSQLFLVGSLCSSLASRAAARSLAERAPMAYHLLPSDAYFSSAQDPMRAVASFAGAHEYQEEQRAYGTTIDNFSELSDFLQAKEGGRASPAPGETASPGILSGSLLDYARDEHDTLDSWVPPAGITLYQIAGWGVDTISGIDFYENQKLFGLLGTTPKYRPIFVEDGDGVVPVPSALLTSTSTENVKRYWLDLANSSIKHGDIFENTDLRTFLGNILTNNSSSLPSTISTTAPITSSAKKLTFYLHSPLTLQLEDSSGNVTGLAEDGSISQDIPGATYGEFGDVKYLIVPGGDQYQLTMHGQDSGTFSLDLQESFAGVITASTTIANVPTTASTLASLTISGGLETASPLTVDENGDGGNVITITSIGGETVNYEPPVSEPEPATSSTGGSGGGGGQAKVVSIQVIESITTASTTVSTNSPQVTIQTAATSTPAEIAVAKPLQAKKKAIAAAAPSKKTSIPILQTASVYAASQQPFFTQIGRTVYNGLYGFWLALKRFF